jgi:dihydrofolate reductase
MATGTARGAPPTTGDDTDGLSRLVVYMSVSLDGFVAAEGDGPDLGLGVGGESLHAWMGLGGPGHEAPRNGINAEVLDDLMASGAVVTGRHTFEWAGRWGGDHHDGVPIFVLTRTDPEQPQQGLALYTSDLVSAVAQAKSAARGRHVMAHGATSVQALLRLGLVDEFVLTLVPVLLHRGRRLFDGLAGDGPQLALVECRPGEQGVVHLRYRVTS